MAPSKKAISFTESVKAAIAEHRMIERGSTVVVGVSGGPDSVALMNVLNSLASELDFKVVVVHMDHALREDSSADADFTAAAAAHLGLQCRIKRVNVKVIAADRSVSVEEAGRVARYEFFAEVAAEFDASKIATAHHLDDEIETFFLRLFRGSSIQGMQGIRPVYDRVIRPFIRTTRVQILDFLHMSGIEYRSDPTNLETNIDRNFIRGRVLPCIRERFPNYGKPLERTMELIRQEDRFIAQIAERVCEDTVTVDKLALSLNLTRLRKANPVIVSRVILSALHKMLGPQVRLGRVHVRSVEKLLYSEKPSGFVVLPGGLKVRRSYDQMLISLEPQEKLEHAYQTQITGPGIYQLPPSPTKIRIQLSSRGILDPKSADGKRRAFFDADSAAFPMTLRNTVPGDRLNLWGMEGSRKVKKIFIDLKVPREQRKLIPLLVKDSEILWIAGVRRGSGAGVTDSTREVVEVEII